MFIFRMKLLYDFLMSLKVDKDLSCVLKYPELGNVTLAILKYNSPSQ